MTPRRPAPGLFALRLLHVNAGLALFGLGIALQIRAGVGLGPWDAFHTGLALRTPLSVGQAIVGSGLAVLVASMLLANTKVGLGTLLNMLVIGPWVDLFLGLPGFPEARAWWDGTALFGIGMVLIGLATGVYLTAGLGAGPRDGFALGLARVLGITVRRARTLIEVVVLTSGWLLGGSVGLGTLAFALGIGPLMQWSLRVCAPLARAYERFGGAPARPVG